MATAKFHGITFDDSDIVNVHDWIPEGEYNPNKVRPYLLHDNGTVLCIVFASCAQEALDKAVDEGKLDHFQVSDGEMGDYFQKDGSGKILDDTGEGITYLGNASEPFDIESIGIVELPNPRHSWCAVFSAHQG